MGIKINWILRHALLARLREKKITVLTRVRCERVTREGVIITTHEGDQKLIEAETVLVAVGTKANRRLYEILKDRYRRVFRVGDCVEPHGILEAIAEGAEVGRLI